MLGRAAAHHIGIPIDILVLYLRTTLIERQTLLNAHRYSLWLCNHGFSPPRKAQTSCYPYTRSIPVNYTTTFSQIADKLLARVRGPEPQRSALKKSALILLS